MVPGTTNNIVYTSPREVFDAFAGCPRLVKACVRHYWGEIEKKPLTSGARAIWQLKSYETVPPVQQHDVVVIEPGPGGANQRFKAIHKADARVVMQVDLLTDVNSPLTEWDLFKLYVLAAAQVLRIEKRYSLSASLAPRAQVSTSTDSLTATLVFHIPIHELIPTANPADDNVSLRV